MKLFTNYVRYNTITNTIMAKKPKESTSMQGAAKAYRKGHTQTKAKWDGGSYVSSSMGKMGIGESSSKLTYKPKSKSMTYGGTRNGKGATIKKRGTS